MAGIDKVCVTFERREDDGLRVWSDDVPGFVLSGHDPRAVLGDLIPALEAMLTHKLGCVVEVLARPDLIELLENDGIVDRKSRTKHEFITKLAA